MRWYLRSKIHDATVTESELNYIGSITIDSSLTEKAGFNENEKVAIWDKTNGQRIETYIILGEKNSGVICINGAAAKKIKKGDKVIIAGFELSDKPVKSKTVLVDKKNRFIKYLDKNFKNIKGNYGM
ncbi:MAG: aspartate 1-decarboxylase [Spirochaetes bacterium]|nr:aspartate 1-decarboxylase [Spirochaetota bacterium]